MFKHLDRRLNSAFWASLAAAGVGFVGLMVYESAAVLSNGQVPTISHRSAQAVRSYPRWSLAAATGIGFVVGALAAHFGDWEPN